MLEAEQVLKAASEDYPTGVGIVFDVTANGGWFGAG